MSRGIWKSNFFVADADEEFQWYLENAGTEVAERYVAAIKSTLHKLSIQPDLGRIRHFPQQELEGIRSKAVDHPFEKHLIFYRFDSTRLYAWRVIHGARDLPKRLLWVEN